MPPPIKVELVPHSDEWATRAGEESDRIAAALGSNLLLVHHVGSTAIPSICAKPILDLMPEVHSLDSLDAAKAALQGLGYEWWGEYGIRGRRYCTQNDAVTGRRLVQLHCFRTSDPEIERHVAFRDYLRAHPETALAYDREKRRCRDLHPDDSHFYTDAKAAWIDSVLPLALDHYRAAKQSQSR
jgi:GrpB-like predicted nucleotidyltransferase (UPF0157 family)